MYIYICHIVPGDSRRLSGSADARRPERWNMVERRMKTKRCRRFVWDPNNDQPRFDTLEWRVLWHILVEIPSTILSKKLRFSDQFTSKASSSLDAAIGSIARWSPKKCVWTPTLIRPGHRRSPQVRAFTAGAVAGAATAGATSVFLETEAGGEERAMWPAERGARSACDFERASLQM